LSLRHETARKASVPMNAIKHALPTIIQSIFFFGSTVHLCEYFGKKDRTGMSSFGVRQ